MGEELVAAACRTGPDQDRAAEAMRFRDLLQGLAQNGDVVSGVDAAGLTGTQHPGQGLTGGVEEAQQRMEPERRFLL
jgi:hypothetical protein